VIDSNVILKFLKESFDRHISSVDFIGAGMFSYAFSFRTASDETFLDWPALFEQTFMEQSLFEKYYGLMTGSS
jgi:hypothetical protein